MAFGGLCLAVALALVVAAYQQAQHQNPVDNYQTAVAARICAQLVATGSIDDDSRCPGIDGDNESLRLYLAAAVFAALGLTQLVGAARVGITCTGSGVIVRNQLRTHRVLWPHIAGFRTDFGHTGPMSYAFGRVDLVNGGSHRIEAICAMPWEPRQGFADERVIDALNTALDGHRSSGDSRRDSARESGGESAGASAEGHVVDDDGGATGSSR
jgi:hypothetical protein